LPICDKHEVTVQPSTVRCNSLQQ